MKKEIEQGVKIKNFIGLGVSTLIFLAILRIFPDKSPAVISTSWVYFKEMMVILPAIMLLMGLFVVWVSKEMVIKYLGESSGIKGTFISFVLGALPTGPMYVAFPLVLGLKQKGASISNIVVFLSAWACIKFPQEMVELQFLGWKFMAARLVLTIIFVTIMGIIIERVTKLEYEPINRK